MKYVSIQQDVMKAAEARNATGDEKKFKFRYCTNDDFVMVVVNDLAIYMIPKKRFYLDIESTFDSEPVKLDALLKLEMDAKECVDTMMEKHIPVYGKAVRVFQLDDQEIWIDARLLKVFDLQWCTFKGMSHKDPVFVYEEGILSGIILPVAHP